MRIIVFIPFSADIHKILEHIGVDPEAPRIAPARGPPLWDECGAQESQEQGEGVEAEPDLASCGWISIRMQGPPHPARVCGARLSQWAYIVRMFWRILATSNSKSG